MTEEIRNFDETNLGPATMMFQVGGRSYTIKTASANTARQYRKAQTKGMKIINGKVTMEMSDPDESNMLLLQLTITDNEKNARINAGVLAEWDNKVTQELLKWVMDNSGLKTGGDFQEQLKKALDKDESPIKYDVLAKFLAELPIEEYNQIHSVLTPSVTEDDIKN